MAKTTHDDATADERLRFCLLRGLPIPDDRSLAPAVDGPIPNTSDPEALRQVRAQINRLKAGTFTSYDRMPAEQGKLTLLPIGRGTWNEMAEMGKLAVLDFWVDWRGVSLRDRQAELRIQLDFARLPEEVREEMRKVAVEDGRERQPHEEKDAKCSLADLKTEGQKTRPDRPKSKELDLER